MPIQMIGGIILVVLVVVTVSIFFFTGISEQGAIMGQTSSKSVGGLNVALDRGLCDLAGEVVDNDGLCCSDTTKEPIDCA